MLNANEINEDTEIPAQDLSPAVEQVLERVRAEDANEDESLWSEFSSHTQK